jgi:hypothetical protein
MFSRGQDGAYWMWPTRWGALFAYKFRVKRER